MQLLWYSINNILPWTICSGLILNPIKEMTKLEKLFEDFHDDSEEFKVSIYWGDPVGKEIW